MKFFTKNKATEQIKGFALNEEIDSKKTSMLGYFFLILMVIFGIVQGNNLLSAIENVIDKPEPISRCSFALQGGGYAVSESVWFWSDSRYAGDVYQNYDYKYYSGSESSSPSLAECVFSKREVENGIPAIYSEVYEDLSKRQSLEKDIAGLDQQINNARQNKSEAVDEYSVSLLETIAKKDNLFDVGSVKRSIKTSEQLLTLLENTRNDLGKKLDDINNEIKGKLAVRKESFQKVMEDYIYDYDIYRAKQFGLSLVFILPVFLFVWRRYHLLKGNRSEYSIIWGGVVAITSFLIAQVLLTFVYEVLPRELLQKIFAFFADFKFFFTILYWLGFILVLLFFGSLIYFIQKRYYNEKAVANRAFKIGACPTCSMKIHKNMIFCPVCGEELKTKCSSCGNYSPASGDFCEICGVKRNLSKQS